MSIDKDFFPYTESLELKELGFDEPCFGYYDLDGLQINRHHWYPQNKNSSFPLPHTTNNPKISAPTFSQAFRWFREKYNLDCSVMLHVARYGITKGIYFEEKSYKYQIRRSFKNPFWIEFDSFKTYEEAELACLRKLIEIVKQKS